VGRRARTRSSKPVSGRGKTSRYKNTTAFMA
jgi:hypothetical protein